MTPRLTRRQVLASGVGAASSLALARAAAAVDPAGAKLTDIEHVVILIQENRSFDHYFGSYKGVRGFDDHPANSYGAFAQPWPSHGTLLPFHFDTATTDAKCTNDITHEWGPQHRSWNDGKMDGFVAAHVTADGPLMGTATMGYYTRPDLEFLYALADAFTICDDYHCSIFGPTDPNRLFSMTATVDPAGTAGGPVITNPGANLNTVEGIYSWTTYPERLQAKGVSWKVYSQLGTNNNVLSLFTQFRDDTSPLFRNSLVPSYPGDFHLDVVSGTLPQVSWVLAPGRFDEHPPWPSDAGESITANVLSTLVANPAVWAKTVLFLTYDENGGFFDHVPPPVAPLGTPGEFVTTHTLPPECEGIAGPIGLGFRVPALVVSPFSRGGLVSSDTFDHTSLLRFLETRFGVEVPNLSAWRRSVTGDLTSTLNLAAQPDTSVPTLPQPVANAPLVLRECEATIQSLGHAPPYPVPATQVMPKQEPGVARRPSGVLAATASASPPTTAGAELVRTGGSGNAGWWGAGLLAVAAAVMRLRGGVGRTPR